MGIQENQQQNKKPQVPPSMPGKQNGDVTKQGSVRQGDKDAAGIRDKNINKGGVELEDDADDVDSDAE